MMDAGAISLGSKMWLLICAVSLIPPATLGALMHLVTLRSARANETSAQCAPMPDHTATVPAVNRAGGREPRHTTEPPLAGAVRPNQAATEPLPSQRTEPTVPPTAPRPQVTVPPAVPPAEPRPQPTPEADRADRTTEPDWEKTVPKVKRGGRPAKAVLDKARKIYCEQHRRGVILTDRVLEAAVNEAFDEKVIGRRACARVISEERQKMRTEKAG
jgi:outer membrane biosynthesis protein TonB